MYFGFFLSLSSVGKLPSHLRWYIISCFARFFCIPLPADFLSPMLWDPVLFGIYSRLYVNPMKPFSQIMSLPRSSAAEFPPPVGVFETLFVFCSVPSSKSHTSAYQEVLRTLHLECMKLLKVVMVFFPFMRFRRPSLRKRVPPPPPDVP